MESYPSTAIAYILALFLAFIFARQAEITNHKQKRNLFCILSLLVIVLFCGLRFFVGNDYHNYFYSLQAISKYNLSFFEQRWEPGTYLLSQFFQFSNIGYIYVLFISSLLTYVFTFRALVYNNILKWGVFFTFSLGMLIMANDQVRQAVAFSIFLFSIKYIEQNDFKQYFKWIIIATLFHYSAIALTPIFFIKKIRLNSVIFSILIIATYIGFRLGIFYNFIFILTEKIPYYGAYFIERERFFIIDHSGSGLGVLFKTLTALFVAVFYNKINKPIYATIFLFGTIIANLSVGFMPIERFSNYLVFTNIIAIPMLFNNKFTKTFAKGYAIIAFIYFLLVSLYGLEKHGAVPYRTILNENLASPKIEYIQNK